MGIVVESIADTNEALITRTAPSGGGDGARCELAFANGEFLHCISSFPSFHTRVARLTGTARRAPARRGEGNFGGGDSATTGVDSASGGGGGGGGASSMDMDSAAGRCRRFAPVPEFWQCVLARRFDDTDDPSSSTSLVVFPYFWL